MEEYQDRCDDSCWSLDCECQRYEEESLYDKFVEENDYKVSEYCNNRQKYLSEINEILSSI